ncbi:SMAD/FHA domain-containing protein [Macrolepiota fuliginosa MF-IS2]|uniref:SMAD/FHA domain-containing protein n=1 Tax=Macrolepiota fuliginosa MF-IS2 TaxID=1400762 RepID=A0A9P5XNK5_9AGAR|nr:SMAD/FHA domain-containing protein [Macrolepiota fuliginosa MF-IS2]
MSYQREETSRAPRNDRDPTRGDRYRAYDDNSKVRNREDRTAGPSSRGESRRFRDSPYERREYQERGREREQERDRDPKYERREYQERDRERERERDRERYDKTREGRYEDRSSRHQRRSASPRSRSSRPRSSSGDRSPKPEKAKPNFAQSGLLAAETNTVKAADGTSTVLKYNEPPEARKPTLSWRLYVFKGSEQVELLHIQRQSAYLIGRDRLVADISMDHPSCSKQHAAIQYRYVQEKGESKGAVKPFIIDLESTNGTLVNDEKIPAARFYELRAGDVIKFGLSTREYVLLNEEAAS